MYPKSVIDWYYFDRSNIRIYGTSFLCKINPTNPGCPIGGGGGGGKKANGGNEGNRGNNNGGGNILAVPFANSYQN